MGDVVVDLTKIVCGECGGVYAILESYRAHKQRKGGYWTCPYCKCSWGFGESEEDRLRKRLTAEEQRRVSATDDAIRAREEAERERRRANGYKGAMVAAQRRTGEGDADV